MVRLLTALCVVTALVVAYLAVASLAVGATPAHADEFVLSSHPAPETLALLGLGVLDIGLARRRRLA